MKPTMKKVNNGIELESNNMKRGIILSYHRVADKELDPWGLRVSPENFSRQLRVIKEFGTPLSLSDFAKNYQIGTVPQNPIVLTFDDGYVDNLSHALPLLNSFDVPATFFISTGYTGQEYFWWEALEHVFLRPNRLPSRLTVQLREGSLDVELAEAESYSLKQYEKDCVSFKWRGEPGSRLRIYHEVYDALWALDHDQRLRQVDRIVSWSGIDPLSFSDSRPLKTQELKGLGEENLVTIGAHSIQHLPLDEKSVHIQRSEIMGSRRDLELILNRPVDTFAYPHGKFNDESVSILKENGFLCACTTRENIVEFSTDHMLLPRFAVNNWSEVDFRGKLDTWLQ